DERHDLVAEVLAVTAGAGRVDELRAAIGRPRVDEDDDRRRAVLLREEPVDPLRHVGTERAPVPPHVELAGHPLDQVNRREAAVGLGVVAGREIDPDRTPMRVAERVATQQLALDLELLEAPCRFTRPRLHEAFFYQAVPVRRPATLTPMAEYGTMRVKSGLAEMLKGGVIMDVVDAEQAKIAEEAGACAVMALERVPADIRRDGGVARMSDPEKIREIQEAVTIPVMAKCRIGHFAEAQILQALEIDYIDESEVLTPADLEHHVDKWRFTVPFVCGCTNLGEALRRIAEGAAMIRTKGEAGSGDIVNAVTHMRAGFGHIRRLGALRDEELYSEAKELRAPYELVKWVAENGKLPVVTFTAGGIATPADASLCMQLGADGVFVGSGI